MSVTIGGKQYDLRQLQVELAAAGVTVAALGSVDDRLVTYTATGAPVSLPAGAAATVAAHTPPADPAPPDYGAEGTDTYRAQFASGVGLLRDYLALAAPTATQNGAALKLTIRLVLFLARQTIR